VWQQRQIVRAAALNLGISDTERIEIQSSGIENAEMASNSGYWQEQLQTNIRRFSEKAMNKISVDCGNVFGKRVGV